MNMVAILTVPLLIVYDKDMVLSIRAKALSLNHPMPESFQPKSIDAFWFIVVGISLASLIWAYWQSRREPEMMDTMPPATGIKGVFHGSGMPPTAVKSHPE